MLETAKSASRVRRPAVRKGCSSTFSTRSPLPADHALWSHPKVVVIPHLAAVLPLSAVADQIADNTRRLSAGDPLLGIVSRTAGY